MISEDVALLVRQQIGDQWTRPISHDLDLRQCIVAHPRKENFILYEADASTERRLWLVLEESPGGKAGYLVFYDERLRVFGLAARDAAGRNIHIGDYGDLWTTLDAM